MQTTDLKIYNIPDLIINAASLVEVDEETGELVGKEQLETLVKQSQDKIVDTARYLRTRQFDLIAMEEVKKSLEARIKAEKKRQEWLNNCLLDAMQFMGIQKITSADISLKLAKKPASVLVEDESLIPEDYIRTKVEKSVDKTLIKDALKTGQNIPGVKLVEGFRLSIK